MQHFAVRGNPRVGSVRGYVSKRGVRKASCAVLAAAAVLTPSVALAAPAAPGTYAYVANTGQNEVRVFDTATNTLVTSIDTGAFSGPLQVAATRNGKKVYVTERDSGAVSAIDALTNTVVAEIPTGNGTPESVAVSPDDRRAYVTVEGNGAANRVVAIDTATDAVVGTLETGVDTLPNGLAVSPDGKRVYVAYRGAGVVAVIDSATMTPVTTVDVGPSAPRKVAISPSGARVYVTENNSGEVSVIDTATNTVVVPIPVGQGLDGVKVSRDGRRVYVADRNNSRVTVIDAATNSVVTSIPTTFDPAEMTVSPTGARLYVSHPNGVHGMSVIDLATNSVSATVDGPGLIGIDLGSVPGTSKVSCPAGSVLTGGGFGSTGPAPDQLVSRPVPGTDAWEVNGQNRTRDDVTLTPYAVCATP
ncbi:cytochrome D1 domain-containing protein [Streptomyces sp. NPDC048606]|uniref:cytochrome D1 domain-containing protein n=1 Tax=Streptomyces sp. NPDC048606 TaxID=3154726 RepID=UPI0034268AEE